MKNGKCNIAIIVLWFLTAIIGVFAILSHSGPENATNVLIAVFVAMVVIFSNVIVINLIK